MRDCTFEVRVTIIIVLIILRTVIEIVVIKNNSIHSNTNGDTSNNSSSNRNNCCHYIFEGVYRCIDIQPSDCRVLFGSTVTLCNMSNSLNSLKGSI